MTNMLHNAFVLEPSSEYQYRQREIRVSESDGIAGNRRQNSSVGEQ